MMVKSMKLAAMALVGLALALAPAAAQEQPPDLGAIVKEKLKADKKLIVATNMQLTADEAKGFWPLYDAYQADLEKANQRIFALIADYAEIYSNDDPQSNERALKLIDEKLALEEAEVQRDRANAEKLAKVLPPRKVIRYLQIESKIRAIVRYELAERIPLIQ